MQWAALYCSITVNYRKLLNLTIQCTLLYRTAIQWTVQNDQVVLCSKMNWTIKTLEWIVKSVLSSALNWLNNTTMNSLKPLNLIIQCTKQHYTALFETVESYYVLRWTLLKTVKFYYTVRCTVLNNIKLNCSKSNRIEFESYYVLRWTLMNNCVTNWSKLLNLTMYCAENYWTTLHWIVQNC